MEQIQEDRCGTDAVGIVVAVDQDGPVFRDCFTKEGDGLLHTVQEKRIVEILEGRAEKAIPRFICCDAARGQKSIEPGLF
jgi:hypothetical protein